MGPGSRCSPSTTAISGRAAASHARSYGSASSWPTGRPRSRTRGASQASTPPGSRSGASRSRGPMSFRSRPAIRTWPRRSRRPRTPTARPPWPTRCATPPRWRSCTSPAWPSEMPSTASPAATPCWCRSPESPAPSPCSPPPMPRTARARSTLTTGIRAGSNRSPPAACCGSASTGRDATPRASRVRCWSSPARMTAPRFPAPRSARPGQPPWRARPAARRTLRALHGRP